MADSSNATSAAVQFAMRVTLNVRTVSANRNCWRDIVAPQSTKEREREMSTLQKRKEEIVAELSVLSKQMDALRECISKLEFEYRHVLDAIYAPAPKLNAEKEYR
jgi:U3 small nucleolar RNA-associated protein 14